jgi:hypothetical protein
MEIGGADVAGAGVVGMAAAVAEIGLGVEGAIHTDNSKRTDHSFVIVWCRLSFVMLTFLSPGSP